MASFLKKAFGTVLGTGLVLSTVIRHLVEPKEFILQAGTGCQYIDPQTQNFIILTRSSYWLDCLLGSPVKETTYWSWRRIDLKHLKN